MLSLSLSWIQMGVTTNTSWRTPTHSKWHYNNKASCNCVPQGTKLFFGIKLLSSIIKIKLSTAVYSMVYKLAVKALTKKKLLNQLPLERWLRVVNKPSNLSLLAIRETIITESC